MPVAIAAISVAFAGQLNKRFVAPPSWGPETPKLLQCIQNIATRSSQKLHDFVHNFLDVRRQCIKLSGREVAVPICYPGFEMANKRLMSVVDAAGYAMAPADDFAGQALDRQLDYALRNGHQSAARVTPPVKRAPSPFMLHLEAWSLWARDALGFGGRAAA